jgi:hypothetical protein
VDVASSSFGIRAEDLEMSKWPGKHRRSLKSRLVWKSTCTLAQRASKQLDDDLPGFGSVTTLCGVVPGAAASKARLPLFILHKRRKGLGVIRVPARAGFHDVARGPENPPLVELTRHIVVRAQDIKVSGLDPLESFAMIYISTIGIELSVPASRVPLVARPKKFKNSRSVQFVGSPASEKSAHHAADEATRTAATAVMVRTTSVTTTGPMVVIGFFDAAGAGVRRRDDFGP